MGIDFLRSTAASFERALDKRAIDLRTPEILSPGISLAPRTATAAVQEGCELTVGERILIRSIEGQVVVQRETAVTAVIEAPPAELVARLALSGGIEIGEIMQVRALSGEVEVALCE